MDELGRCVRSRSSRGNSQCVQRTRMGAPASGWSENRYWHSSCSLPSAAPPPRQRSEPGTAAPLRDTSSAAWDAAGCSGTSVICARSLRTSSATAATAAAAASSNSPMPPRLEAALLGAGASSCASRSATRTRTSSGARSARCNSLSRASTLDSDEGECSAIGVFLHSAVAVELPAPAEALKHLAPPAQPRDDGGLGDLQLFGDLARAELLEL